MPEAIPHLCMPQQVAGRQRHPHLIHLLHGVPGVALQQFHGLLCDPALCQDEDGVSHLSVWGRGL